MRTNGDDCEERQTRVDRMIDEFREAQSRRRARASTVKSDAQTVELPRDAEEAIAGSSATPSSTPEPQ